MDDGKICNFKIRKRIHILEEKKTIRFVNMEIDPKIQ